MPQISIIIPVYNAGLYIEACIKSLLNQTFTNCEFIFVNDGSTDSSKIIIESYKEFDKRITLINQQNQGVSIARNNGITIAKGEYIGFVDADDWVENDMYATLFAAINNNNCDIVLCNMSRYFNDIKTNSRYNFPVNEVLKLNYIKQVLQPYLIKNDDLYSSCNKLFKSEIIKKNSIKFPEGNALSEDNIFNLLYFDKVKRFIYLDYAGYNYREVTGSATRNIATKDYFKNVLKIYNFNYRSYMNLSISDEEINSLKEEKLINSVVSLLHLYFTPTKSISFFYRVKYIKKMINNTIVKRIINNNFNKIIENQSRFDKFILIAIKQKSIVKLYLATTYSRYRNK